MAITTGMHTFGGPYSGTTDDLDTPINATPTDAATIGGVLVEQAPQLARLKVDLRASPYSWR